MERITIDDPDQLSIVHNMLCECQFELCDVQCDSTTGTVTVPVERRMDEERVLTRQWWIINQWIYPIKRILLVALQS